MQTNLRNKIVFHGSVVVAETDVEGGHVCEYYLHLELSKSNLFGNLILNIVKELLRKNSSMNFKTTTESILFSAYILCMYMHICTYAIYLYTYSRKYFSYS